MTPSRYLVQDNLTYKSTLFSLWEHVWQCLIICIHCLSLTSSLQEERVMVRWVEQWFNPLVAIGDSHPGSRKYRSRGSPGLLDEQTNNPATGNRILSGINCTTLTFIADASLIPGFSVTLDILFVTQCVFERCVVIYDSYISAFY